VTRFIGLDEVLELHRLLLAQSGGMPGVRDLAMLESAVAQPLMTFGGQELYPSVADKAAALCFSLVMNHPFADGNKRVGHAAMETFLVLNGHELSCSVSEQEKTILDLASGLLKRDEFATWVKAHMVPAGTGGQASLTEFAAETADASVGRMECPDSIADMPVVCFTPIDSRHRHTRKTRHIINGELAGPAAGLAICKREDVTPNDYFLVYCNEEWELLADSWHASLEAAQRQAEFEYEGVGDTWRNKGN